MISPQDLARLLAAPLHSQPNVSAEPFTEIVIDSREVTPGALFVALPGEQADGHQYVDHALQQGAAAVLVSAASQLTGETHFVVDDPLSALQAAGRQWRQERSARIIGITGSVGKTTLREAAFQLLQQRHQVHQSPRNFNGDIGLPIALLGIKPSDAWAVIEIGPYSEEEMQLLVTSARADVGIVTNVGPTHLERFGSFADTERIKGMLPASVPPHGLAILNGDDPRVRRMAQRTRASVVTYGLGPDADLQAQNITAHGFAGIEFDLHDRRTGETVPVRAPLIGAHLAMTALPAAAAALHAGFTLPEAAEALSHLTPGSRLAQRQARSGATIIDDSYNAAPLSMQAALDLLQSCAPRRIALLGDMYELGTEERAAHEAIGEYAVSRCDWLLAVGERSRDLAEAAHRSGHPNVCWLADSDRAAAILARRLTPADTLLVKASHAMHLERVVERLLSA